MKKIYYFAYGMNTNEQQMMIRCPNAVALGKATLYGHRFEFKNHATVTVNRSDLVEGVLWLITSADEESLDILEGYPQYYLKKAVKVDFDGKSLDAMTYYIPGADPIFPPYEGYYQMVYEGYRRFGVSTQQLEDARQRAEDKSFLYKFEDLVDSELH